MYYLYLKTSPLGLKYLGKFTTRANRPNFTVFDYIGSGTIWKQHVRKHNLRAEDLHTEVLLETNDYEELQRVAMEYSNKFQVAENSKFANLVPEDGACPVKYVDFSKRATLEYREKISKALKGRPKSEEQKSKMKTFEKGNIPWNKGLNAPYCRTEETKAKMRATHAERNLKLFKDRFDPIIEDLLVDLQTLGSLKKIQKKYKIGYTTIQKIKKIYG